MGGRSGQFLHHSVAVFPSKDPHYKQTCDLATTLLPCSHIWTQLNTDCRLWHQWDSGRRWDFTLRYRKWKKKETKRSRSTTKRSYLLRWKLFEGPWFSICLCAPFKTSRTGILYSSGSLPVLGSQAGYWWVQPEASKLNSCLFQSNFYKVTPAGVFFIFKQEGCFNRDLSQS